MSRSPDCIYFIGRASSRPWESTPARLQAVRKRQPGHYKTRGPQWSIQIPGFRRSPLLVPPKNATVARESKVDKKWWHAFALDVNEMGSHGAVGSVSRQGTLGASHRAYAVDT